MTARRARGKCREIGIYESASAVNDAAPTHPLTIAAMENTVTKAEADLKHALRTSAIVSRIADKPLPRMKEVFTGVPLAMNEPASSAILGLLAKLLPAGIGAALMIAVDPPKTKRELFLRVFVAFACSFVFGGVLFDMLRSFTLFAFLDPDKRAHTFAVECISGAFGWFVIGGASMWLKRFSVDPATAIGELPKA